MDMPKVRFGTFGGRNITPISLSGTAQLAPKNSLGKNQVVGNREFASISNAPARHTPAPAPGVKTKGTSPISQIVTTTQAIGAQANPTLGDTPVSHVTQDPVFITPNVYSRENKQWEGNITGETVPRTIGGNLIQKIRPKFGFYSGRV